MHKSASADRSRRDDFHDFPLADADQCVKCGLCLPHCPTYKLSQHEGDSPRGRIALMQGLAQGIIKPEGSALPHLDGCLVCRACEPVCPADVPYGRLIDKGREGLWRSGHRPEWMWRVLAGFRRTPRRLAWLVRLLRFAHASGAANVAARLPLGHIARAARFVERAGHPPSPGLHAPSTRARGDVTLFLGCIARSLDSRVLHAAIRVLNAMQFNVHVPAEQTCCGAMDAHAGDARRTIELARANVNAFSGEFPVLTTASGCGIQLKDYRELSGRPGAPARAETRAFSARVHDIMHFIAANADRLPPLASANASAVVHTPCTLRNGMRESGALDVLKRIPALETTPLQHLDCCGAAGSYLFEHAKSADSLGRKLLDSLGRNTPGIFVTSNVGCALHVRRLARERGLAMTVKHPVELLAECLDTPPSETTAL